MRERIILAPGANQKEIFTSLASHGNNCINLKILGSGELAKLALMKSGVSVSEDFLSPKEMHVLIASTVDALGNQYFKNTLYSDIKQIANAINTMRSLVVHKDEEEALTDALKGGTFTEKNDALLDVYRKYISLLKEKNVLDNVSLIRKAIAECTEFDADFQSLEEYPLSPIEKELLRKVSGGKCEEISISSLYGVTEEEKIVNIEAYKNCYGAPNEVETIIDDIYRNKKTDTCTVAVTDPSTYAQLFFDYALLYDLPITFGCGIPITNSNPAKLLGLYHHWTTDGFFGSASLMRMLKSEAFNRGKLYKSLPDISKDFPWNEFYEVLGSLKLTNDETANLAKVEAFKKAIDEEGKLISQKDEKAYKAFEKKKILPAFLSAMAKELAIPVEEFISKYAYIRKGSKTSAEKLLMTLDMSAAGAIFDEIKVMSAKGIERPFEDIVSNVLGLRVGGQGSTGGAIHVTDIAGALGTVRPNLYIAGLSASIFPGRPRENYLLLDGDLELFGGDAFYLNSEKKITQKKKNLKSLVSLASGLKSNIYVLYAGMNVSELKRDNASSVIYELLQGEHGENVSARELEEHIEKVDYFRPAISVTREIGNAYNQGKVVSTKETEETESAAEEPAEKCKEVEEPTKECKEGDRYFSPSALATFFNCPRKFMLQYLLGIPEPEDEDLFQIISPMDKGNLAHSLMEQLANTKMEKEDFIELSGQYFDRFIAQNPPIIMERVAAEKANFLQMMETGFDMDPRREVILKEEELKCTHKSGVKIHGYPDRVEKTEDGKHLVVDFKTGKKDGYKKDDIGSCLQIIIYAYLMENHGVEITGGEYRFIKSGEKVSCKYDEEIKKQLNEKLLEFKKAMEDGEFPCSQGADDKAPCKYCKYRSICGKN